MCNTQFDPNLVEIFHKVILSTTKTPVGMKNKKGPHKRPVLQIINSKNEVADNE